MSKHEHFSFDVFLNHSYKDKAALACPTCRARQHALECSHLSKL